MGVKFIIYINLFVIILLFNISENKKVLSFSDDFDGNELNLNFWKKANRLDCEIGLEISLFQNHREYLYINASEALSTF
jgi:hypothetical protein